MQTIDPEIIGAAIEDVISARIEAQLADRELRVLDRLARVKAGLSLDMGDVTDGDVEGLEAAGLLTLTHTGPFTHLDFTPLGDQLVSERREGGTSSPAFRNLLRDAEDKRSTMEGAYGCA